MQNKIRELRKAKGWTLDDFSQRVGTSIGYLSDLERGRRTGGVQMLQDIAQALEVPSHLIFESTNDTDTDTVAEVLELVADFMKLSREDRETVRRIVNGLLPNND